ncbi:MAG: flavin reductase family protein [Bacteroidota bacterium]
MSDILSLDPKEISQQELHGYLLTAVAPRPIAFASTIDKEGNINLSPFSFFNVFSSNPPVMVFSPARRGRDNSTKHTYENVLEVPETVISIVNYPMVEQMSLSSTEYAKGVNEFEKAGFTMVQSDLIKPPRIGEAPVNFECIVDDVIELGNEGGAGNLVIARVVKLHVDTKYLNAAGKLDTRKLDLVGRMGGMDYVHANGAALFEIPKPLRTKGVGVDQLPDFIRNSEVLTGNNLGRLGNIEVLPDEKAIHAAGNQAAYLALKNLPEGERSVAVHRLAKDLIEKGDTMAALATLLTLD